MGDWRQVADHCGITIVTSYRLLWHAESEAELPRRKCTLDYEMILISTMPRRATTSDTKVLHS